MQTPHLPIADQEEWEIDDALIHLVGLLGSQAPLELLLPGLKHPDYRVRRSRYCVAMTRALLKICVHYWATSSRVVRWLGCWHHWVKLFQENSCRRGSFPQPH